MTFAPSANSIRWLAFRNDAGQSIPAFAALRPLGVVELDGEAVLRVGQPNADGATGLFNGPFAVDADGLGSCTSDLPCYAAYDTLHMPAVGEMWGPVAGQWTLARDKPGYRIVGGAIDGRVQVMAARRVGAVVGEGDRQLGQCQRKQLDRQLSAGDRQKRRAGAGWRRQPATGHGLSAAQRLWRSQCAGRRRDRLPA